ncbi:MAG: SUMF1/EgtB/PvdO family nonheme iron enzyme [Bacteroidales bacterium]|jgi:formylglycine-generating enzyme required for sulfatase activity|nr:SUMF1/EgtB/PvdO family nonheme iron enzyme [Bacteroidales bacterium]
MKNFLKILMTVAVFGLLIMSCQKPVDSVSLDQNTLMMKIGTTATLVATVKPDKAADKSVTWSTSDAEIATVENGKITALAEGKTTVTVITVDGNKSATCQVTVNYDYIESDYGITLVPVEGGTFTMGSANSDAEAYSTEKPAHQVTVSGFKIMKYEVTQKQWHDIMDSWPAEEPNSRDGAGDNYPAYNVSWNDIQAFITKLNQKTGKKYRLPTEAEWEFAARGGIRSKGFKYSGSNNISDVAYYRDNSSKTNPVGSKQPNELGIYDMSGNVGEWCYDWDGNYTEDTQTNPTGPATGTTKITRGGSWNNGARNCRVAYRENFGINARYSYMGFRLVLP